MSKVCRRWREVASEPVLWKKVDLSITNFQFLRATNKTIKELAPKRLTAVTELSLSGWNKLTDNDVEVHINCFIQQLKVMIMSHMLWTPD